MPIYEYRCRACGAEFETLVLHASQPNCSSCGSEDLERLLSAPAVTTPERKSAALGAARKKLAGKQRREALERHEEEAKHPHDH